MKSLPKSLDTPKKTSTYYSTNKISKHKSRRRPKPLIKHFMDYRTIRYNLNLMKFYQQVRMRHSRWVYQHRILIRILPHRYKSSPSFREKLTLVFRKSQTTFEFFIRNLNLRLIPHLSFRNFLAFLPNIRKTSRNTMTE